MSLEMTSQLLSSGNVLSIVLIFERIEGVFGKYLAPEIPTRNAAAAPDFQEPVICPLSPTSSLVTLVVFSGMDHQGKVYCFSTGASEVCLLVFRFGFTSSGCGFLEELDTSMASVEGSPQMFDWFSSPDICVAPDQGPCLFILGPVVALIESDPDQPVNASDYVLEECERNHW